MRTSTLHRVLNAPGRQLIIRRTDDEPAGFAITLLEYVEGEQKRVQGTRINDATLAAVANEDAYFDIILESLRGRLEGQGLHSFNKKRK